MRYILTIFCTFCLMMSSWAIPNEFKFRHYSVEDGLSSNTVRTIIQDKYGFMWFGTDEGLNRYDGTVIKTYCFKQNGRDQSVSSLFDAGNRIWIGTYRGIYLFNYTDESFIPFNIKTKNNIRITKNITSISHDKDGNIWITTMGQGVFRYSPSRNKLDNYNFKSLKGNIAQIMIDNDNQIWATTTWGTPSLWKLNKAQNIFQPVTISSKNTKDHGALVIFNDSEGNIWLGTWEHGLMKFNNNNAIRPDIESVLSNATHIHSITEYAPHILLIGCDDGLILFNTITRESKIYNEDETNTFSLSNRFVYPITKDREGGIWIGTFYGGVNYISPNAGQFTSYAFSRLFNSVNGNVINRFCEDNNGNIWIASDDGGLNCLSPSTGHFINYMPQKSGGGLSYHNVHGLCVDGNNLWIGTYTGGINVLNLSTGTFKHYNSIANKLNTPNGTSCYSIFKDSKGNIWTASMDGVDLYNRKTDDFTRIKKLGYLTIDIDEDRKGQLWFSTQGGGLYCYNPNSKKWKHYSHSDSQTTISNDQVNCTMIDSNGQMFVATMCGLCKYDARHDNFKRINLNIPSQDINCIIEDNHTYWLTTSNGLIEYLPGESLRVFTKNDGLRSDQFLPNAGFKASDGRIYIGSVNGFNAFYPYQLKINHITPNVFITGLDVFNKNIHVGSKMLPQSLNTIKELNLSYDDNVFSLLFASLSYCTPEKNQYAYKLEGFDKQWNYVGSQNKATYTNLSPGTYIFHVKASNNDGIWSNNEATLKIIVHPPFYLSLPMKLIYLILLITSIIYCIKYLLRRSERRHAKEISLLNENKEREVREARLNFFTMIAHEIRTPVSLIIGPLENIMKLTSTIPDNISNDLNIIDRNAHRLLDLVNQLLDFRKIEQKSLAMKFSVHNINNLIHTITERFKPDYNHKGIKFSIEYPDENFVAIIDSEAITKVISNLLTNAGKYTKDKVLLKCTVDQNEDFFNIEVTDNGAGIRKEDQKKIFQPFFQAMDNKPGTGIGLNIVKNIVDQHHGMLDVKSEIGEGSSFVVKLPVKQKDVVIDVPVNNKQIDEEDSISSSIVYPLKSDEKQTMLIVDDNEDMVNFLTDNFKNQYNVITAEDGISALEQLKKYEVTLIVSDWMMPRMDGTELCHAVRTDQNTSHIPFIMLTAKTDNDSKVKGMDCGADIYIEKPFSMQYLEACIKNMIELRQMLRNKFSHQPLEPISKIANNPVDNEFLDKMEKLIEENFSNPDLSVNFLATQLCISRSGLFAKIKTLADTTPNEMIQIIRLKKAALLISEGKQHINEICYMVGFNNPSYFSKCFQKQFGIKPGEFYKKKN